MLQFPSLANRTSIAIPSWVWVSTTGVIGSLRGSIAKSSSSHKNPVHKQKLKFFLQPFLLLLTVYHIVECTSNSRLLLLRRDVNRRVHREGIL